MVTIVTCVGAEVALQHWPILRTGNYNITHYFLRGETQKMNYR